MFKKKVVKKEFKKYIEKKINIKISNAFKYAQKSKFPNLTNWSDLNMSKSTFNIKKILKKNNDNKFDSSQELFQPKGY